MTWFDRYGLWTTHLLCALVIFIAAWPVLENPRLEADDYRYLHHIQQVSAGNMGAIEAMTVENRWDHLWFMQEEGRIRFFRPTVLLSYALDKAVWRDAYPLGLTLSNVWTHLGCSMLVGFLLFRLLGAGLPALVSSVLFAGLAAHAECIWYVAGRTDSLAAFGFLSAFALHVAGRRWWALPCFALGFITKELVIVAPVVFFAFDRWVGNRKLEWPLYAMYGLVALAVLGIKQLALGGEGSDFLYPYLVSPFSARFPEHLWLQFRSYAGNLLAAEVTVPFADAGTVAQLHRPLFPIIGTLLLAAMGWLLRRDRRLWLFLLFGVLVWLPTSFVYLSERYLYLPSFAFVGLLGLFVSTRPVKWRIPLCMLLAVYAAFQSSELRRRHVELAGQPGSVQEMMRQLEPVREQIEPGDHLLLVNTPGLFVRAQFVQDILRVEFDDPALRADVLTMMPGQNGTDWNMGSGVRCRKDGEHGLVLEGRVPAVGRRSHRIQEYGLKQFDWSPLTEGSVYKTSSLEVRILSVDSIGATAIAFELLQPLENHQILVWHAGVPLIGEHPWIRRKDATVQQLFPGNGE